MIHVRNTPNYAGVKISGDIFDFEELYESLHLIAGEEGEYTGFGDVRIRVLGFCYDLRHAMMGNRGAKNVPSGLNRDRMRHLSFVGSEYNVYYQFEVLWPELLFVSFSLTELITLYERKENVHAWDSSSASVRKFQAAVSSCLEKTLTEKKFLNLKKYMRTDRVVSYYKYATQYIDQLNIDFIEMNKEKRLNNISIIAKRIGERDHRYMEVKHKVLEVANFHGVSTSEIRFGEEYPEEIDW